jgi:hypothetical protein
MVMTERLFSNYQNESVITIKMKVFFRLFRRNTITLKALKALFSPFISFILKDLSKYFSQYATKLLPTRGDAVFLITLFCYVSSFKKEYLKIAASRKLKIS